MNAPKAGVCYCGCGQATDRHFVTGHDLAAVSMLHFLKWDTTDMAAILREEGYGPHGEYLRQAAELSGWPDRKTAS